MNEWRLLYPTLYLSGLVLGVAVTLQRFSSPSLIRSKMRTPRMSDRDLLAIRLANLIVYSHVSLLNVGHPFDIVWGLCENMISAYSCYSKNYNTILHYENRDWTSWILHEEKVSDCKAVLKLKQRIWMTASGLRIPYYILPQKRMAWAEEHCTPFLEYGISHEDLIVIGGRVVDFYLETDPRFWYATEWTTELKISLPFGGWGRRKMSCHWLGELRIGWKH
jgi:hypothetical protein